MLTEELDFFCPTCTSHRQPTKSITGYLLFLYPSNCILKWQFHWLRTLKSSWKSPQLS